MLSINEWLAAAKRFQRVVSSDAHVGQGDPLGTRLKELPPIKEAVATYMAPSATAQHAAERI
nr:hypothetical protein [Pseudomonas caspiana]